MVNRTELLAQIEQNVEIVINTERDNVRVKKVLLPDGTFLEEQAVPVVVVKDAEGTVKEEKQKVFVVYDANGADIEAYLGDQVKKNYAAPENSELALLTRFAEIEAEAGAEVKIDPAHLDKLGIKYLVFEASGVKKVTATINDVVITRESL